MKTRKKRHIEKELKILVNRYNLRSAKASILIEAVRNNNYAGVIDTDYYKKGLRSIIDRELHITEYIEKAAGKMIGIPAFGTTCHATENCKRNIENAIAAGDINCPCLHCYSALGTVYDFDSMHLIVNHDRLQEIVSDTELTNIVKHSIKIATTSHTIDMRSEEEKKAGLPKRYETFPASYSIRIQHKGDTDSAIECRNYARFAEIAHSINPSVSVTAYTKFPGEYAKAMKLFPEINFNHLRIGYSAYKFGEEGIQEAIYKKLEYDFLKFGFVVYDREDGKKKCSDSVNKEYVKKRFSEVVKDYPLFACKCDPGSCGKCGVCYGHNIDNDFIIVCELCR